MKEKAAQLEADLAKSQSDLKDNKIEVAETFDGGFYRDKEQVHHFFPDHNLCGLDSFKIVKDGELVDEP